ncbi:hypothetical protein ECEC1737_2287, partial [Escherichia coli EC1737]
ADAGNQ